MIVLIRQSLLAIISKLAICFILYALKPLDNTWPLLVEHSLGSAFKHPDAEPTVTITTVKSELFKVVTAWKEQKFTKDQLKQMSIDPNL